MSFKIFITGTDTNVGKTYTSLQLLNQFRKQGLSTVGLKPIASGCNPDKQNEDALALQQAATIKLPYSYVNPFAFYEPVSPHFFAEECMPKLSVEAIINSLKPAFKHPSDIYLIEGVGGWHAPINQLEDMADFVLAANASVILVVGIRLGCLNHAKLTYNAIQSTGVKLHGWIANCIDPNTLYIDETIETLKNTLAISYLGKIGFNEELKIIKEKWAELLSAHYF